MVIGAVVVALFAASVARARIKCARPSSIGVGQTYDQVVVPVGSTQFKPPFVETSTLLRPLLSLAMPAIVSDVPLMI